MFSLRVLAVSRNEGNHLIGTWLQRVSKASRSASPIVLVVRREAACLGGFSVVSQWTQDSPSFGAPPEGSAAFQPMLPSKLVQILKFVKRVVVRDGYGFGDGVVDEGLKRALHQ